MMAAAIDLGRGAAVGIPKPLFQTRSAAGAAGRHLYSVTRDGSRFLIATPPQMAATMPLTVVLNWPSMIAKR